MAEAYSGKVKKYTILHISNRYQQCEKTKDNDNNF